jgi:hypothetical protein
MTIERLLADELYQYMKRLQELLQQRGAAALAEAVQFATCFAGGSTTEFYAEAQKVLREISEGHRQVLGGQECDELRGVLERINMEFRMIGGA